MDKAQAIHNFWSSFSVPAYDANTVPQDAPYPRITYEVSVDDFDYPMLLNASLWYNSTGWADISQKADEIERYIGLGGITIPYDGGMVWIKKGKPFYQRMGDENYSLRRILINIEVEFI